MKGFIGFMLVFVSLMLASVALSNADPISVATARAEGDMAMGSNMFALFETASAWVLKLTIGAVVSSVVGMILMAAWKWYQRREREERSRRWNPGPNARWQQGSARVPSLKREDLMLLAMMNGRMPANGINSKARMNRSSVQDEEPIDLEF